MTNPTAVERVTTGAAGAWRWVGRFPTRLKLALRDLQDARTDAADRAKGPSFAERQANLIEFYTQYESLVELLCDSAQYGPDAKLEGRYEELRVWMQQRYPILRPYVVAYLQHEIVDARQSHDWLGASGDAFEALFAAPTLDAFVRSDDGQMILRIDRTRRALNLYGEHLRHLVQEEKGCA